MLTNFDWLRICRDGSELLAVLELIATQPHILSQETQLGHPLAGLTHPCQRCWILPKQESFRKNFCQTCSDIQRHKKKFSKQAYHSVIIWGEVNQIPRPVHDCFRQKNFWGFVRDPQHFLAVLPKIKLKFWLQDIMVYHGSEIEGVLVIFPTAGESPRGNMSDVLCTYIFDASRTIPNNRLWVRFYPRPFDFFNANTREKHGLIPLEITEFIHMLEMASIFRSLLRPDIRDILFTLLKIEDFQEEQFYWGRFMAKLTPESKDMLNAWNIRRWPKEHVKLLYDLTIFVPFTT